MTQDVQIARNKIFTEFYAWCPTGNSAAFESWAVDRISKAEASRDEFERKGKDLCCSYGNSLITIHDLEAEVSALKEQVRKLTQPVSDEETNNFARVVAVPTWAYNDFKRCVDALIANRAK